MKHSLNFLVVLCIAIGFMLSGLSAAKGQESPSDSVEVIIQGKKYKSIRAYKREQIKNEIKRVLSSHNLMEFSEDELFTIVKEVRKQQTSDPGQENGEILDQKASEPFSYEKTVSKNTMDLSVSQMQDMLTDYKKTHKKSASFDLDPEKVKSVTIKPHK